MLLVVHAVPFSPCFYLYIATVKRVVLVFVNALYKSPLSLSVAAVAVLNTNRWMAPGLLFHDFKSNEI